MFGKRFYRHTTPQAWRRVGALALLCSLCAPSSAQIHVISKGDGTIRPDRDPGWYTETTLNLAVGDSGFPLVAPTQRNLKWAVSDQFSWQPGRTACTALQVQVSLPEVFKFGQQSVYKLDDKHGLLLWLGDVNRTPTPLYGSGWQTVFDNFCHGHTRGYHVFAHPVLLARPQFIGRDLPFIQFDKKIADVRLIRRSGATLSGNTQFQLFLNTSFAVRTRQIRCPVQLPRTVPLNTVRRTVFETQTEVPAATFEIRIGCANEVPTALVLTDLSGRNQDDTLLRNQGSAQGVNLALYAGTSSQRLRFGHALTGQTNRWPSAQPSTRIAVKYVKTQDAVRAGTVNAMASIHIFYR